MVTDDSFGFGLFVPTLTMVLANMHVQLISNNESSTAIRDGTCKWPLAGVQSHVIIKISFLPETLATFLANKWHGAEMNAHVKVKIGLLCKIFVTIGHRANKWPLAAMFPQVKVQLRFLCKSFAAFRFGARVRFLAGMRPHVTIPIGDLRESFTAIPHIANIRFFTGVRSQVSDDLIFYFEFLAATRLRAHVAFDFLPGFSRFSLLEMFTNIFRIAVHFVAAQFNFHLGPMHVRKAEVIVALVIIETILVHMFSQQEDVEKSFLAHIAFK